MLSNESQECVPQVSAETEKRTEDLPALPTFSSSSPDDTLVTTGISPLQDEHKGPHDLLKWVASNLGIQAEVVKQTTSSLLDFLSAAGPSRVLYPLMK